MRHIYNHPMLIGVFYLPGFINRNKAQFETVYASQEIYTDLITSSIGKYFHFNNFLCESPLLSLPFFHFDVIADKVHVYV